MGPLPVACATARNLPPSPPSELEGEILMHGYSPILVPVVALVAWSILVMLWMFVARFSAFRKAGITLANAPRGGRGVDLEGRVDATDQWKSHNYNHLMEQPTLFYAIALTL